MRTEVRRAMDSMSVGGGASSHDQLDGNNGTDCHPVGAISGLQTALDGKAVSGHNHDGAYDAIGAAAAALASALAADFSGAYAALSGIPLSFPPSIHTHDYNALTNKPTLGDAAAKNTGTAPGTLAAGDHTHAGGGSDPWTYLRLPADCTISTSAAADVTNGGVLFGFTPAANTSYIWEAVIALRTATASVNPRLGFAWSSGMADGVCSIEQTSTATAKIMSNGNIAASLLVAVGGVPTNSTSWPAICYGVVRAGATPSGNCRMQLASETAGTIVRVVAAVSYFRYRVLP